MLSVRSLSISYGRARAVSDVSFPVGDHELVVMVGRNGAGKTTILSAIVGLLRPAAGSIWLGESRLDGLPAHRTYGAGVVLVPQGRGIFRDLSVRDNLFLGSFPRVISRRGAEVREDYERLLERFPILAERERLAAGQLSGGEQQVLAIARALMGRPRLLLLDEPFMGLDPRMRHAVADVIRELHGDGRAILVAEQNVDAFTREADQVIILNSGVVVEVGRGSEMSLDRASLLLSPTHAG